MDHISTDTMLSNRLFFIIILYFFPMVLCGISQDNYTNVALGKPNIGNDYVYNANDGHDTSCNLVMDSYRGFLWLIVDLENHYEIPAVRIYKKDNYITQYPFEKFYIYVSEDNPFPALTFTKGDAALPGELCVYREAKIPGLTWTYLNCNQSITGRFVTWWMPNFTGYLYICELEVLASNDGVGDPPKMQGGNAIFDVVNGKKSLLSPFYSKTLIRPYPILCAMACLEVNQNLYEGRSRVAQLEKDSGLCQCIVVGSFQSSSLLVSAGSHWCAMELHMNLTQLP